MTSFTNIYKAYSLWLSKQDDLLDSTKYQYGLITIRFINYLEHLGYTRLNDASYDVLVSFIKGQQNVRPVKESTITAWISALQLFFAWSYQSFLCNTNPTLSYIKSNIKPKTLTDMGEVKQPLPITLDNEEQSKLLVKIKAAALNWLDIRNRAIIALSLSAPFFAEEILSLSITDIDLQAGYCDVKGPNRRERRVVLDLQICEIPMLRWIDARKEIINHDISDPFLFVNRYGSSLSRKTLHKILSTEMQAAGIHQQKIGSEVLRHTVIKNMKDKGLSLEERQKSSGIINSRVR